MHINVVRADRFRGYIIPDCVASKHDILLVVKNGLQQCRLHGGEKSKSSLKR